MSVTFAISCFESTHVTLFYNLKTFLSKYAKTWTAMSVTFAMSGFESRHVVLFHNLKTYLSKYAKQQCLLPLPCHVLNSDISFYTKNISVQICNIIDSNVCYVGKSDLSVMFPCLNITKNFMDFVTNEFQLFSLCACFVGGHASCKNSAQTHRKIMGCNVLYFYHVMLCVGSYHRLKRILCYCSITKNAFQTKMIYNCMFSTCVFYICAFKASD